MIRLTIVVEITNEKYSSRLISKANKIWIEPWDAYRMEANR